MFFDEEGYEDGSDCEQKIVVWQDHLLHEREVIVYKRNEVSERCNSAAAEISAGIIILETVLLPLLVGNLLQFFLFQGIPQILHQFLVILIVLVKGNVEKHFLFAECLSLLKTQVII